jgi:hypothetical protein
MTTSQSSFIQAMDQTHSSKRIGENGAAELTARGVEEDRVALFFALVRGISPEKIDTQLRKLLHPSSALSEEEQGNLVADAFLLTFQTRHCRGGKGEKDIFYQMMAVLAVEYPQTVTALLPLIPHFGSFKDWFQLIDWAHTDTKLSKLSHRKALNSIVDAIYGLAKDQFHKDLNVLHEKEKKGTSRGVSLLAKWAPRENKAWSYQAKRLAHVMFPDSSTARKDYRKLLSSLNKEINTTEVMMSNNAWSEIDFASQVPSVCLMRNRKAFLNEKVKGNPLSHDEDETGNRKPDDLGRVACRKKLREIMEQPPDAPAAKKLKGKQLFPHEIVSKIMNAGYGNSSSDLENKMFSAQWEDIRISVIETLKKFKKSNCEQGEKGKEINLGKMISLVDVSGSMSGIPMEVAIALGLLVSEISEPAFANRCLTFESEPTWVTFDSSNTLSEKVTNMMRAPWGGSTNFEAAMERILEVAVQGKLSPEQIPDLIVFSDMQFDEARSCDYYAGGWEQAHPPRQSTWETHHERIVRRFKEEGLRVFGKEWPAPHIVYWNLRGDTNGFPAKGHTLGVTMLSGFSPSLMKVLLDGDSIPTPYSGLRKVLDDKEFDNVREILNSLSEKKLKFYKMKEMITNDRVSSDQWELVDNKT